MSERRGVTFERLNRMEREYAEDDDVLDVIAAVKHLAATSLQRQVEDLQRQLAETTGQVEVAQQATREIMAERNTWARQLADMRDERDTAREETEKAREMLSIASTDRDNLHVAMETLAQDYANGKYAVYHRGHQVARDIRRVIARWETT